MRSSDLAVASQSASLDELVKLEEEASAFFSSFMDSGKNEPNVAAQVVEETGSSVLRKRFSGQPWRRYGMKAAELQAELSVLLVMAETCLKDPKQFPTSIHSYSLLGEKEACNVKIDALRDMLDELKEERSRLDLPFLSLKSDEGLLEEVQRKVSEATHALSREEEVAAHDTRVKKRFLSHLQKLGEWTEKQVINLESVQEDPSDIQAFAFDFVAPCADVAEKLDSIFAPVRDLASDAEVTSALSEFCEMWFFLLDSLVHRLSCLVIELHDTKPLDTLLGESVEFLQRAPDVLRGLQESLVVSSARPTAQEECATVTAYCDSFPALATMLGSWRERYALQQSAVEMFREVALSRLTFVPSDEKRVIQSIQRQQDFDAVTEELRAWAEEESHADSWREIYSSIVALKNRVSALAEKEE